VLSIKRQDAKDCTIFRFALDERNTLITSQTPEITSVRFSGFDWKKRSGGRKGIHLISGLSSSCVLMRWERTSKSAASAQTFSTQAEHAIY